MKTLNVIALLALLLFVGADAESAASAGSKTESEVFDPFSWPIGNENATGKYIEIAPSYFINKETIESISYTSGVITLVLESQRTLRIVSNNKLIPTNAVFFHLKELLDRGSREVTQPTEEQREILRAMLKAESEQIEFNPNSAEFIMTSTTYIGSLPWKVIASYCKLQAE